MWSQRIVIGRLGPALWLTFGHAAGAGVPTAVAAR
jgi:hypothetical protein